MNVLSRDRVVPTISVHDDKSFVVNNTHNLQRLPARLEFVPDSVQPEYLRRTRCPAFCSMVPHYAKRIDATQLEDFRELTRISRVFTGGNFRKMKIFRRQFLISMYWRLSPVLELVLEDVLSANLNRVWRLQRGSSHLGNANPSGGVLFLPPIKLSPANYLIQSSE
jgi:hypothetical protein